VIDDEVHVRTRNECRELLEKLLGIEGNATRPIAPRRLEADEDASIGRTEADGIRPSPAVSPRTKVLPPPMSGRSVTTTAPRSQMSMSTKSPGTGRGIPPLPPLPAVPPLPEAPPVPQPRLRRKASEGPRPRVGEARLTGRLASLKNITSMTLPAWDTVLLGT
jgi:hypothetical protein